MIYLASLIVLFNLFRGIHEGMIMFQSGVRNHYWFTLYHRQAVLPYLFAFLIGAATTHNTHDIFAPSGLFILIGSLILSWQAFESAYSYARYKKILPDEENILGLDIHVEYTASLMVVRLGISAALIIIGGIIL